MRRQASTLSMSKVEQHPKYQDHSIQTRKSLFLFQTTIDNKLLANTLMKCRTILVKFQIIRLKTLQHHNILRFSQASQNPACLSKTNLQTISILRLNIPCFHNWRNKKQTKLISTNVRIVLRKMLSLDGMSFQPVDDQIQQTKLSYSIFIQ